MRDDLSENPVNAGSMQEPEQAEQAEYQTDAERLHDDKAAVSHDPAAISEAQRLRLIGSLELAAANGAAS